MKGLTALITDVSPADTAWLQAGFEGYTGRLPPIRTMLGRRDDMLTKDPEFVVISGDEANQGGLEGKIQGLKRRHPLANIMVVAPDTNTERAPNIHNRIIQKYNLSVLRSANPQEIQEAVTLLDELHYVRQKVNLYVNGSGKLVTAFLRQLKNHWHKTDWVNKVGLFSTSCAEKESDSFVSGKQHYEDIRTNLGIEDFKRDQLECFNTLEEWAQGAAEEADVTIFATGPFINTYEGNNREGLRGKESNAFVRNLFERTYPRVVRMSQLLKRQGYHEQDKQLWILSNPIGALSAVAAKILDYQTEIVSSPTPDGIRTEKILRSMIDRRNIEVLKEEGYSFSAVPVYGEHHQPIPYLEGVVIKNGSDKELYLSELPGFTSRSRLSGIQRKVNAELQKKGVFVMQSATRSGVDFSEAPEAVYKALDTLSRYAHEADPLVSYYHYVPEMQGFLQSPQHGFGVLKEIANSKKKTKARGLFEKCREQANAQKQLLADYLL